MFRTIANVSESGVRKIGPWFLPQRICELLVIILRNEQEDPSSINPIWQKVPILANLLVILQRWHHDFEKSSNRIGTLEEQNQQLVTKLIEIQSTLERIVTQNEELQSDIFELQKRVVNMQEDSLFGSKVQLIDEIDSNYSDDSISNAKISMSDRKSERGVGASEPSTSAIGRLFSF